ncbi:hypothetical protein [Bacillus thuringiensis]
MDQMKFKITQEFGVQLEGRFTR